MKRLALLLAVLAALVFGPLLAVNSLTSGLGRSADEFFVAVREERLDTAMNYLSTGFRNNVTPSEFEAWLAAGGMDRFEASAWDSQDLSSSQGELGGVIFLDDGSVLPLEISFVYENEQWRIHAIEARLPGISPHSPARAIPPLRQLESLATTTMARFGGSVASQDFESFYQNISALWRSRTSPARLRAAFEPFMTGKVNLIELSQVTPVFSEPPFMDAEGRLRLVGYFPHELTVLTFDLTYTFEYPEWKLLGLNVAL